MKSRILAGVMMVLAATMVAQADLTLNLDYEFSGGTAPTGPKPWLVATLHDAGANQVTLTLQAHLTGTEFVGVGGWAFNFNDALDLSKLGFSYASGEAASSIQTGVNTFKADGDGYFDILFNWPKSPPINRFGLTDQAVYTLTYTGAGTMNASSFNFWSAPGGGNGSYRSAAHIQGVGPNGAYSGWIGDGSVVPAPGAFVLILIGLGLIHRLKARLV